MREAGCGSYHAEELPSSRDGLQGWTFPGGAPGTGMGALGLSAWDICKQTQPRGGIEGSGVSGGAGAQSLVLGLCLQVQSIAGCWCNWLVDLHVMLRRPGWVF